MSLQDEGSSLGLIPKHGDYRRLRSFKAAQSVYDATVIFCDRFIDKRSRTHDQMIQAARSGVQNIAEGSMASATSRKTELKLTNVARASLYELLTDYEDFLRQRQLRLWDKDSPSVTKVRRRMEEVEENDPDPYRITIAQPQVAANIVICLIHQATYLLRRQIEALEKQFLEEGGFTERMYRQRNEFRKKRKG